MSDSVPSCGCLTGVVAWLYFVVRSSDRALVVDVDLLTAGSTTEREIAGRRGKGQCTVSRGPRGDNTFPVQPSPVHLKTEVNCQIKTFPFPHFAHLFSTRSAIIKWWPGVRAYVLAAIINQCWTTRYYMFPFVKTGDSVIIQSNMTEHFPSSATQGYSGY